MNEALPDRLEELATPVRRERLESGEPRAQPEVTEDLDLTERAARGDLEGCQESRERQVRPARGARPDFQDLKGKLENADLRVRLETPDHKGLLDHKDNLVSEVKPG